MNQQQQSQLDEMIQAYLDGVLAAGREKELAAMLAESPEARQRLASQMRLQGAIFQLGKARVLSEINLPKRVNAGSPPINRPYRPKMQIPTSSNKKRKTSGISPGRFTVSLLAACLLMAVSLNYMDKVSMAPEPESPVIAVIDKASGISLVTDGKRRPVTSGWKLRLGDTIHTSHRAVIRYKDDKTTLQLNKETSVTFQDRDGAKHLEVHEGRLYCAVAKQPENKPMMLETDSAQAVVLGTRFYISRVKGGMELMVTEGAVRVIDKLSKRALVTRKGEMTRVDENGITTSQHDVKDDSELVRHQRENKRLVYQPQATISLTSDT